MALTSDQITAQNFADFYTTIKPYLNGGGFGMKKLWENPNPTSTMSANVQIDLSSGDYDMLFCVFKYQNSTTEMACSATIKGYDIQLSIARSSNVLSRALIRTNDTTYKTEDGSIGATYNSTACIPIQIYGIKLYAYDNISCVMMSSTWEAGETTVEFTDPIIDGDSIFDVYLPSQYADLIYSSLSVSGHTLTITFPSAQASDIEVKLRVNRG